MENAFDLVWTKLQGWLESTISLLPNFVVAVIVFLAFVLLAKLARKLVRRFFERVTDNVAIARVLSRLTGVVVIAIGFFIALGAMKLDKTVTSLLAGAGVLGLALAFAFQDMAANLIAGIYMSFKKPFAPGDLVETNDVFGTVEATELRSTLIRTSQGQAVLIPNKEIFENKLVNYTRSGKRRIDLPVGVSYGDDLEHVRRVAIEAVSAMEERDPSRDVELFFQEFGSSSIDFVVRFWIPFSRQRDFQQARSEAIMRIKKAFDDNDVAIPFPIRTLDFGVKGGEHVRDALGHVMAPRGLSS